MIEEVTVIVEPTEEIDATVIRVGGVIIMMHLQ